jgi:ATP-dependent DNA ligase
MSIAFDLLYRAGEGVTARPLQDRRVLLEDLIAGGSSYLLPARRLANNGLDAWPQAPGSGWEGYRGGVTRSWLKVKVPGWTDPEDKFKRVRVGYHARLPCS